MNVPVYFPLSRSDRLGSPRERAEFNQSMHVTAASSWSGFPAVMSGLQQIIPQRIPGPQEILKTLTGTLALSGSGLRNPTLHSSDDGGFSACPKPQLSCQTEFRDQDTCCFNYPGGQILQTQFWDADPAVGPDDSWTVHGLW